MLVWCILLILVAFGVRVEANLDQLAQEQVNSADVEWEYEPRLWSREESDLGDYEPPDSMTDTFTGEAGNSIEEEDAVNPGDSQGPQDPHLRHYFLKPDSVGVRQQQSQPEKCTQYRVDTREAVICDKRRCDKFEFEWPQYNNQLTMIETTKHGMRFHRVDLAFASQNSELNLVVRSDESKSTSVAGPDVRGKPFDIFEFFKPKPSTTPTSTTAAPAETTTVAPPTEPATTTLEPTTTSPGSPATATSTGTETTSPITTTSPADNTEAPITLTSASRIVALVQQDANTTQLMTTFRVDTGRLKQRMIGFGGALSDSSCRNIRSLSPFMAKSLMEDYFGEKGIRYSLARLTIGSSDFSTTPYTNNDKETNRQLLDTEDDVEMKNFKLTKEDYDFKLPVARQAIASSQQEVKFFASLWSPPVWMKNNSHIVHGYLKGDIYGPYYKALSELMLKWLEAYRKSGIELWGLTGMNEPVTGIKPFIFHNSLGITKEDYITFYKLYLGPMLRQRGFQNIKLMALDDNKGHAPFWLKTFLADKEASKFISGVALHWYMNDEYENLNFIAKDHPDKFILSTEACNGYMPFQVHVLPGNWDRGVAYMYDIIKMIQKNSAGWVDWNMALDLYGGPTWAKNNLDAAVIVNAKRDEYYKSPMFYAIGHFSKFIDSDSVRLDHRLANARYDYPLEAVAFYCPSGYVVIVALNANKHTVPFRVIVDKKLVRIVTLRADSFTSLIFKWKSKVDIS